MVLRSYLVRDANVVDDRGTVSNELSSTGSLGSGGGRQVPGVLYRSKRQLRYEWDVAHPGGHQKPRYGNVPSGETSYK